MADLRHLRWRLSHSPAVPVAFAAWIGLDAHAN